MSSKISWKIGTLLLLALTAQARAWAADSTGSSHPYACVLNFERRIHPLSGMLSQKLSDMDGVKLVNEARPIDILKCLDEGAVSVMIVGHAADLESPNQVTAPLVYFRELKGQDRQDFLNRLQTELDDQVAEFKEKVRTGKLKSSEGAFYYKIFELDQKVGKIPADQPISRSADLRSASPGREPDFQAGAEQPGESAQDQHRFLPA